MAILYKDVNDLICRSYCEKNQAGRAVKAENLVLHTHTHRMTTIPSLLACGGESNKEIKETAKMDKAKRRIQK